MKKNLKTTTTSVENLNKENTERKKADEALRESESKLRQLTESLPQLVWSCLPEGPCDYLSRQWIEYTGIPEAKQIGYGWLQQLHPDDRERVMAEWKAAVVTGAFFDIEFRIRGKDGAYRWFKTRAVPIRDAQGKLLKWYGSNTNIQYFKQTEQNLSERVKELNCLHGISILMGRYNISLDEIFRGIVELIPPAWQYSDITGARIVLKDQKFQTANFHKTAWMQAHDIVVHGKSVGCVEVCYLKPVPTDGPTFLKEEDRLLNIIAERLGRVVERKRAEEALRESEAKYNALFTSAAEGILVADLKTEQFRYTNPTACRMFGYTEEEFTRLGVADIHPKESLDHVMAEFMAQARGEKTLAPDIPCLRKDGTLFYANISGIVIILDGRHCVVGFFTDITEHKRMEEEKRRLEKRSRKVVEDIFRFIPVGVLVFSRNMKLLRQNQAFRDLASRSAKCLGFAEDKLGNLIIDKVKDGLQDNNIKEIRITRKHETKTGEKKFDEFKELVLELDMARIFFAEEEKEEEAEARIVVSMKDITERKRAEKALRESEERFRLAIHATKDGLWEWNIQTNQEFFSPRWCEIIGYSFDDPELPHTYKSWASRIHPDDYDRVISALNNHLKKGAKYDIDYRHRHKSGEYRWQNSRGQAVFDENGKPAKMVGCIIDITARKLEQEKLLTSEKLAVMGRLTADVAHELNNPLAIIIGGTQLVLSRLDKKPSSFKSQLETVLRNARRCKTILSCLLGYGRTIGTKEEAVILPDLIREAIEDVNYQYDMSGIETVLNCPGFAEASNKMANAKITGNRSALFSIFVNLIRNARQAMGEKGRLTITIEKEDKKHLRIEIHDTGIGISKQQKAKLFKPFTSGWKDATSAQKALSGHLPDDVVESNGLGLATSLGIIETHGGSMSAKSAGEGKGATFTILLPCEFKGKK